MLTEGSSLTKLERSGGADETRTRDLLRDRNQIGLFPSATKCHRDAVSPIFFNRQPISVRVRDIEYHPVTRVDIGPFMWTFVWT